MPWGRRGSDVDDREALGRLVASLEATPLAELAAELLTVAFGPGGIGEARGLVDRQVASDAVLLRHGAPRVPAPQLAPARALMAEAWQLLEHAGMAVFHPWLATTNTSPRTAARQGLGPMIVTPAGDRAAARPDVAAAIAEAWAG